MATLVNEVGFRAKVEDNGAASAFDKIADAARRVPPAMQGAAGSMQATGAAAGETGVKVEETSRKILKSVPGIEQLNRRLNENAKYAANCASINGKYQHTLDGIAAAVARGKATEEEAEEMRRRANITREKAMALAERQRDAMAKSFAADPSIAAAAGQAQYAVALEGVLRQYDKMHGANARYAEETARVTAVLDAANATEKQRSIVLRGVADAYDPVTRAALEAAEALEREAAARQKVIAAAKAQQAAEDAQGRFNQALGVRPVVTGSASASAAVFMEAEQNAAALENLRRKYDAAYAAEARHREEVAHVVAVTKAANLGDEERAALLAKVAEAHSGAARSTAAHGQALRLLVPQLNDVFVTAAMGMNPLMIAIQQGPQIIDAFVLGGKEAGAEMLRLAATAAPIALLVGTIAALAAAQESYAGALRETARVNALTGGSSGFSDAGLERNAEAAAKAAHISVASARDVQNAYVATGQIGGRVLTDLTKMTRDYAAATNQDMGAASQELAGMFADPGRAAEDAAKRWKIFDDAQVRVIKNLQAQGRLEEAQMRLLDGLNGRVQGAAEKVSIYAQAWHEVKTAISDAWTATGRFMQSDQLEKLRAEMEREKKSGGLQTSALGLPMQGVNGLLKGGATDRYWAAVRAADGQEWQALADKADADFKNLQSRAMSFVRGMTPAIALAEDFANAQDLMNRAVAAGAISSDQAAQALRAYGLQVQQTIDPSKTLVDAVNQETQALNLQAGAARNAWTALQQLQRQQPGREIGFDLAAGVQQGVAERSDAQSADRARQVDALAAAERRLNQARIAGNPREVARATVELGIAQKQAAGETVNAAEKTALHAQAQRGATAEIDAQVHQLGLQVDAAERAAAAAGKGEAAQRRAAIETQVAAAALKGLGLETRMALEMQEAYVAAGIHAEFAGQIDQEVAANERLVAAMGRGVAAYRDAEIHNKAVAQALKETTPEYDAAGHATGLFSEAISANIALLKKQQGAADSVDLGKYVEKLENARKDMDFRGSVAGMSDEAKAVAKAQYDTAEALRRQYGEYEKLGPAQQRQWDTAVKLAEENARIEEGVKRQEDAWNQLGQIGERAFDRIGDAVTQLFLEGKNKAISWGSLMKSVAASVAADIAKMGVNDLKRMVGLGGSGGGLLDLLGGSGGGRGANAQAGGQGGGGVSVSGLGDLFSGGGSAMSSIWGNSGSLSGYLFGNAGDPLMTGLSNSGLIGSGGGIGGVPIGQIAGGIGGALGLFSAFQQFKGGNVVGGIGSAIGGGLGLMSAFAPAAFAALGPLGPIAMVAAPLLGSLFGKGKEKHPASSSYIDFADGGAVRGSLNAKHIGTEGAAQLGDAVAVAINKATASLLGNGVSYQDGPRALGIEYDVKADHYVARGLGFADATHKEAEAAVADLVFRAIKNGAKTGLDDRTATALASSKATDLEGLSADLSFARNFDEALKSLNGKFGFAEQASKDAAAAAEALATQIAGFKSKTAELGLPLHEAAAATKAYVDAMVAADLPAEKSAAQTAIDVVSARWRAMSAALEEVGYSAAEAAQKLEQGLAANLRRLGDDYVGALQREINETGGKGHLNSAADIASRHDVVEADLKALGRDTAGASTLASTQFSAMFKELDADQAAAAISVLSGSVKTLAESAWTAEEASRAAAEEVERQAAAVAKTAELQTQLRAADLALLEATGRSAEARDLRRTDALTELNDSQQTILMRTWTAEDKTAAATKAAEMQAQRGAQDLAILRLQGRHDEALKIEQRAELDAAEASLKPLIERRHALENEAAAATKAAEMQAQRGAQDLAILRLQGRHDEALKIEQRAELDAAEASLKPLIERRHALENEAAAATKAAEMQAQRGAQDLAILRLQGRHDEALKIEQRAELEAAEASLKPLIERRHALENEAAAAEKAAELQASMLELDRRELAAMADAGKVSQQWATSAAQAAADAAELAAATDEATRARLRGIQALEAEARALAKNKETRDFNADLSSRRQDLLGDAAGATMTRFDLSAAQQIERAAAAGQDVAALRGLLAAERAQAAFDAAKQVYLTQIDREIRARQESTESLRQTAVRVVQLAKAFGEAADSLKLSDKSDLSPAARLDEARRQFEETASKYRAANDNGEKEELAQKVQALGNRLVEIGYGYYQTTDYSDYRRVLAVFDEFSIANDNAAATAEETIRQNDAVIQQLTEQRRTAERLGERQLSSLDALLAAMNGAKATLDAQLAQLSAAVAPAVQQQPVLTPEEQYFASYDDLSRGRAAGWSMSAQEHYALYGAREGRQGFGMSLSADQAYLVRYADVAAAVAAGSFRSGADHFEQFGRSEGRQYASGGLVVGGTPGVDSVRAWLMPGERVLSVPHATMLERIYAMAEMSAVPANAPPPPVTVFAMSPAAGAVSPSELAEIIRLLRELIALIGAEAAKALAQSGAVGGATLAKLEELIAEIDEQTYQQRKAG